MRQVSHFLQRKWRLLWLVAALALYVGLASYQLGLPGLHYDEAAEAGVNAMELLTGAPVTVFRGAALTLFGWQLPLMVQDYIGALNVYLALPFLAFTGIGVPNLRILPVLTGLVTLMIVERAASLYSSEFGVGSSESSPQTIPHSAFRIPHSLASLLTITLLAASPSFVFWSRQGIFVTNLTQPLCFWCIWQGLRWLRSGRSGALIASAFAAGLAVYAKLLAVWIIAPFGLLAAGWWLWRQRQRFSGAPPLSLRLALLASLALLAPLLPLLLFNWETGGTLQRITGSLGQSYYGVDNRALLQNLAVRWQQLLQSVRGDQLWYLGGVYANSLAPWLAGGAILAGLLRNWRTVAPPLVLLLLAFAASLFTVSDLFVTHYALLHPLVIAVVGISLAGGARGKGWGTGNEETGRQGGPEGTPETGSKTTRNTQHVPIIIFTLLWLLLDLNATVRYHLALAQRGGLADHSDASYQLAYHLRYNGLGAPIALDWGLAAPVRYLSQGTVTPIEIFGYGSFQQPDVEFAGRLRLFLANPDNVYLLHAPGSTVFAGRRELFAQESAALGLRLVMERQFTQRDGVPLYELWRAVR